MTKRTKKSGVVGKYGTCCGASLQKKIEQMEAGQHRKWEPEFIGTIILIFLGTATTIVNEKKGSETLLGLAASSGLAVLNVILATEHISGAHLDSSVTISFAALKHFPWKHVPAYTVAQVLDSLSEAFMLKGIFNPMMRVV